MLEELVLAYVNVCTGNIEDIKGVATAIKALPRTIDGVFDLSVAGDVYEAARYAYPVYCAYETVYNKKEGYPDLITQMRVWNKQTPVEEGADKYAALLDMQMNVLGEISPEIYEYYRELLDMFREDVKLAIAAFYKEGAFAECVKTDEMIKKAIKRACDSDLLLAEKYEGYTV